MIERIDQIGERYVLDVRRADLVHNGFYDFAHSDKALAPGGTYRAAFGGRELVFKVDTAPAPKVQQRRNLFWRGHRLRTGNPSEYFCLLSIPRPASPP